MSSSPVQMLKGNLRALDRYSALVVALDEPANDAEAALLVLLARLLSDTEVATLIALTKRGAGGN